MIIKGIIPEKVIKYPSNSEELGYAIKEFYSIFPNAHIHSINGQYVIGMCRECNLPIFEDTVFHFTLERDICHSECWPRALAHGEDKLEGLFHV